MWIELILACISLVSMIFKEVFNAKTLADQEKRAFKLSNDIYMKAVNAALSRQVLSMADVSEGQKTGWDAADGIDPNTGEPYIKKK